jgi:hypothetical protein
MKRSRLEILEDIINYNGDINSLEKELSLYPWDSETELVQLNKLTLVNIINQCIHNEIPLSELTDWANLIECRDDISYDSENTKETIHILANPELNNPINLEYLLETIQ